MAALLKVTSKFKINQIAVAKITMAVKTSLEQTAEALHTEVVQAQVMPRRSGHLQNDSTFVDRTDSAKGRVSLVSSTPYARRMYFHPEYHFRTKENPNARGLWYDDWVRGSKRDFCPKAFAKLLKRNGGI